MVWFSESTGTRRRTAVGVGPSFSDSVVYSRAAAMDADDRTSSADRPSQPHHELQHSVPLERSRQLTAADDDDDEGTKTFHMAPPPRHGELGWSDGYGERDHWPVYDPFTGLRTAAVLGGLMLLMLFYILYKTRCGGRLGRRRWTSKDRLFVERYKRKVGGGGCCTGASCRISVWVVGSNCYR